MENESPKHGDTKADPETWSASSTQESPDLSRLLLSLQDDLRAEIGIRKELEAELRGLTSELEDRVREINCLYEIFNLIQVPHITLVGILARMADPIAQGCRDPENTGARIVVQGAEYASDHFRETSWVHSEAIMVRAEVIGKLSVYRVRVGAGKDGPAFLPEERTLLHAVAGMIGRIVERRRVEDELREGEERFRAVFESARDCIFIKNASLRYTRVNPAMARLLGMDQTAIIGRRSEDIFGEEAGLQISDRDLRVLAGHPMEQIHTRPVNQVPLTFYDITVPLRDSDGNIVGLCGVSRNITDLKSMKHEPPPVETEDYPSKAIKVTMEQARLAAATNSTILLLGESGTGKDHLARWIHAHSRRASGPYFVINCAALPHELAESELFGHEPGAYTGARARKKGLLELAEGGSLLLNEIGELSLPLQAKLLTFLDTKSFLRVGGERSVRVEARLIAATHRKLVEEVRSGRFLAPLFYRLNVFVIEVPPLRARVADLPVLVTKMAADLAREMQVPEVPNLDDVITTEYSEYHWPGNVRELRNVVERALMLGPHSRMNPERYPSAGGHEEWTHTVKMSSEDSLRDIRERFTADLCREALRRCRGNRTTAARSLGISRDTLYRYIRAERMDK
ncbi:MAG: sigma 54-interacting transcriptional regulator [Pseudomonadota bacterium]